MRDRRVLRGVVAASLLLLGVVAVDRLPIGYTPVTTFPLLSVQLSGLPETEEVSEIAERWVLPLESEIRALGHVRGMRGDLYTTGAWLQVLLEPGTDPESKAARLGSSLARLRASLPAGASVHVLPATDSGDDLVAVLWAARIDDERGWRRVAERFRGLPGVREVDVFGGGTRDMLVRLREEMATVAGLPGRVRNEIERALTIRRVGTIDAAGQRRPVLSGGIEATDLGSLPIRLDTATVPLDRLAELTVRERAATRLARYNGTDGVALLVYKANDASLLEVDRSVRRTVAELAVEDGSGTRLTLVRSEAEPLRILLRQIGIGFVLAALCLALVGTFVGGVGGFVRFVLPVPLVTLTALNLFWIAGVQLNLLTLLALVSAVAVTLPFAVLRLLPSRLTSSNAVATLILGSAVLPVAVALGGGKIVPILAEPAWAFFLAIVGGAPTVLLLAPLRARPSRFRRTGRVLRTLLRDPLTVLLFSATLVLVLLTLFGSGLELRRGSLQPNPSQLTLDVALPDGTTLEQTADHVRNIERRLAAMQEIDSFWTLIRAGGAAINLDVARRERDQRDLQLLRTRLIYALPAGVVSIRPAHSTAVGGRGGGLLLDDEIEDRAETDRDSLRYRVILRSTDEELLRTAYERIRARAVALNLAGRDVQPEWPALSPRIELSPRFSGDPEPFFALAAELRRRSVPPVELRIAGPDGERLQTVRVLGDGDAEDRHDIPQKELLLRTALRTGDGAESAGARLRDRVAAVQTVVLRQSGRFVLPVTVRINRLNPKLREELREKLDRSLSVMELPAGCDLERPSLIPQRWTPRKLRTIVLAAMLPLLLFAVAAFSMNSLLVGLGALFPGLVGLAAATPLLRLASDGLDELTLLLLAAVLCGTLPLPLTVFVEAGRRLRDGDGSPAPAIYRVLRQSFPVLAIGAAAMVLLFGGAGFGADPSRFGWAASLRVAAIAAGVTVAASAFVVPALGLAALTWLRRDPEQIERAQNPPAWRDRSTLPQLAVRNLTKIYGNGVCALKNVSFELEPGIVGLVGPNGAGKTTLIRLLTGLLSPTRGTIDFIGAEIRPESFAAFRRQLGFLPQEFSTHATVTATQFLEHWALERGIDDRARRRAEIERLLGIVGLEADADRRVSDYSGGMRRRVGIALALLGDPRVLIVDEPTTGLDLESRIQFREALFRAAGERVIIFSTHIASDVEAVATRLLLLHHGRLRFDGSPAELIRRAEGRVFRTVLADTQIRHFTRRYRTSARVRTLEGLRVRAVAAAGEQPPGTVIAPTLEEAYLAEIERADAASGQSRSADRFAFLDEARTRIRNGG